MVDVVDLLNGLREFRDDVCGSVILVEVTTDERGRGSFHDDVVVSCGNKVGLEVWLDTHLYTSGWPTSTLGVGSRCTVSVVSIDVDRIFRKY